MARVSSATLVCLLVCLTSGCGLIATFPRSRVDAVPLSPWNQNEPHGIPYYLPKPLLVIAKNVRHVEESQIGLTNPAPIPNTFDNQASYADVKANVTVPDKGIAASTDTNPTLLKGEAYQGALNIGADIVADTHLNDGLQPEVYYTYQIIFVPDLTQKYGLRIKGGPGEIRAAMNFVNGWMYTGMGPYYVKDSSTAQNLIACGVGTMYAGRGVADVVGQAANLAEKMRQESGSTGRASGDPTAELMRTYMEFMDRQRDEQVVCEIPDYAEITIYEPVLTDCGQTEWRVIANQVFDREYFPRGQVGVEANRALIQSMLTHVTNAGQPESARRNPPLDEQVEESAELNELGREFAQQALGLGPDLGFQESASVETITTQAPPAAAVAPAQAGHDCGAACGCTLPRLRWHSPPEQRPQYKTVMRVLSPDLITSPVRSKPPRSTGQGQSQGEAGGENPEPPRNPFNNESGEEDITTGGSQPGE
jgi:hypothetical protein